MNAPSLSLADRFWIAHRRAAFALGTVFLGGMVVTSIVGRIWPHYAWAYVFMSSLAFLAYGPDESAAVANRWRWSKRSLHWIALLYGWPGALIGQHTPRHKSRKTSSLFFTWLASAANIAIFAYLTGFYRWSWQWALLTPLWHWWPALPLEHHTRSNADTSSMTTRATLATS